MSYLDMLTRLGVGSAHPGGFSATQEQLKRFPLSQGVHILEVGCGTGRTACYLAKQGFTITGLDIRNEMLAKANLRAKSEEVEVNFVQGSITALPFADQTFDVILAESVTNFDEIPKALAEYSRVLKPGGILYDREVIIVKPMPEDVYSSLVAFFEFGGLLDEASWLRSLEDNGFHQAAAQERSLFQGQLTDDHVKNPDQFQIIDQAAFFDANIWKTSLEHDELITKNRDYLGYALFVAHK